VCERLTQKKLIPGWVKGGKKVCHGIRTCKKEGQNEVSSRSFGDRGNNSPGGQSQGTPKKGGKNPKGVPKEPGPKGVKIDGGLQSIIGKKDRGVPIPPEKTFLSVGTRGTATTMVVRRRNYGVKYARETQLTCVLPEKIKMGGDKKRGRKRSPQKPITKRRTGQEKTSWGPGHERGGKARGRQKTTTTSAKKGVPSRFRRNV